jgi:hypothetical protein
LSSLTPKLPRSAGRGGGGAAAAAAAPPPAAPPAPSRGRRAWRKAFTVGGRRAESEKQRRRRQEGMRRTHDQAFHEDSWNGRWDTRGTQQAHQSSPSLPWTAAQTQSAPIEQQGIQHETRGEG